MRKITFISILLFAAAVVLQAQEDREPRRIFTGAFNSIPDKAAVFKPGGEWFPSERTSWNHAFRGYCLFSQKI